MNINPDALLKNANSTLQSDGSILFSDHELPISKTEWKLLASLFQGAELNFETLFKGDTDEKLSLNCLRIKKQLDSNISNQSIFNILTTPLFTKFLSKALCLSDFEIDRCQAHIYKKGDFLGLHNDKDSAPDYLYSCIISFSSNYSGGEFILYDKNKVERFKPLDKSLLIIKSGLFHEVKEVLSGERRVLVFFIKNKKSI